MTLTIGTAPFGARPSGRFNFDPRPPEHVLHVEPSPRRVRVLLGGKTVADSTRVQLLQPPSQTAVYLFPREDVHAELEPFEHTAAAPGLGEATFWSVRAGDTLAEGAAYAYTAPPQSAAMVQGLVAFQWDAMDAWFEEDEEVFVHPRDRYHRIDVLRSSRRVVVRWGDTVVAESNRPRMLVETGLPVRWYLPREDVRPDLLAPSYTTTGCPYKGVAQYWTLRDGDREERDVVWSYPEPMHDAQAVEDLLCFFDERLELTADDGRPCPGSAPARLPAGLR
jgi:uncharacterized protein (DUF427 family)